MQAPSQVIRQIVEETRQSFFDFVDKRRPKFPTVLERMAADPMGASIFLRPAAWISPAQARIRDRRYLFLSFRYRELIARLPTQQVAVIGIGKDYFAARRLGLRTCPSADLFLASHAILFGKRGIPVARILDRWLGFFARQDGPCYLVMPHDTSPISLLLSRIAARCPNMRSVCIQHGLFNAGYDQDDLEGRNSRINLVYDEAQKREMLRRLPSAIVEPMGFPADFPDVSGGSGRPARIVLVGTGETEQPELLATALEVLVRVAGALRALGAPIEYRPHPAELRGRSRPDTRLALNRQDKNDLLAGPRKLFVGFNSTLLYEAFLSGHLVVVLDHPIVPGYQIREFGLRATFDELDQLASRVEREFTRDTSGDGLQAHVGFRFEAALRRADPA